MPITFVKIENPSITLTNPISFFELFKIAPCGVIGAICAGNAIGTVFNLAPIFSLQAGASTFNISVFMSAIIFSGILLQRPMGKLADQYKRESILLMLLGLTTLSSQLILWGNTAMPLPLLGIVLGSTIACIYPVSVASTYEKLSPDKTVASSSALLLSYALGGFSGPVMASLAMDYFGNNALFNYLSISCMVGIACLVFYNQRTRETNRS